MTNVQMFWFLCVKTLPSRLFYKIESYKYVCRSNPKLFKANSVKWYLNYTLLHLYIFFKLYFIEPIENSVFRYDVIAPKPGYLRKMIQYEINGNFEQCFYETNVAQQVFFAQNSLL